MPRSRDLWGSSYIGGGDGPSWGGRSLASIQAQERQDARVRQAHRFASWGIRSISDQQLLLEMLVERGLWDARTTKFVEEGCSLFVYMLNAHLRRASDLALKDRKEEWDQAFDDGEYSILEGGEFILPQDIALIKPYLLGRSWRLFVSKEGDILVLKKV